MGAIGDEPGAALSDKTAVTLWFHLAPNLQMLDPFRGNVDTAIVVGLRGKLDF